jgi:hypothetical protein
MYRYVINKADAAYCKTQAFVTELMSGDDGIEIVGALIIALLGAAAAYGVFVVLQNTVFAPSTKHIASIAGKVSTSTFGG